MSAVQLGKWWSGYNDFMRVRTICVEGTIGAGKTSLMRSLGAAARVGVLEEDLELWRNVPGAAAGDGNLLQAYYSDQAKVSTTFQMYAMLTRFNAMRQDVGKAIKIVERSIYSSREIFARMLLEQGKLTPVEHAANGELFRHFLAMGGAKPDAYIYLKTSPAVAFARLQARGRPEEKDIPLSYLERLGELHDEFFKTVDVPVVTVDGDQSEAAIRAELRMKCAADPIFLGLFCTGAPRCSECPL
jgi:deoxyadenosine/deoxycytidine kinase